MIEIFGVFDRRGSLIGMGHRVDVLLFSLSGCFSSLFSLGGSFSGCWW